VRDGGEGVLESVVSIDNYDNNGYLTEIVSLN
jgi:hypothetical protein